MKISDIAGVVLDAETDGLMGKVLAICAKAYDAKGVMVSEFAYREAGASPTNPWVATNVWPHNADLPEVHNLHAAFAAWWVRYKGPAYAHMGAPVESGLFRALYERGLMGEFDGPYPLHDVASILLARGMDPTSVDSAADVLGVRPSGSSHDCRYDVEATRAVLVALCE